jgi:RHS repeat-associated protein
MIRVGTVAVPVLAPHQKVNLPMPLPAGAVGDAELRTVVVADPADTECSTANNVASSRVMAVAIEDYGELEDLYRWAARVDERMVAPTITSTPPVAAVEHVRYRHQLVATSPHAGDVLTYQLSQAPDGATVDPLTGEVTWTPPWGRVGAFPFGVLVTSRNGLTAGKSWTVTVTASPEANTPPVITSTPSAYATAGQAYRYDVVASDPEGQRVTYRLEVAPPGMAIDSARGILLWLPTAAAVVPVRLVATDERGASTRQDFDVRVYATANQAPVLASAPPLLVNVGATYRYDVVASDPDGDPLAYAWTAPPGAVAAARALTWTPDAADAGEHAAAVEIRDDRGGSVRQRWTVFVNDPAHNATPQIASVPAVRAVAGRAYAYQVVATDADGDPLTYALARAPAGMAIDAAGLVRWTPALTALGDHAVQVQASDGRGGVTWQSFTLRVVLPGATNGAPSIASAAPLSAKVGRTYAYPLVASDPDDDALAFTLVDGPAGMSLHPQTGLVTWSPAATGPVDVRVSVSDGELVTEQAWTVTVVAADAALAAQLRVTPDLVSVDEAVAIELVVENASGPTEATLLVDGAPVALDGHGRASVRSTVLGAHVVTATVIDGPDQAVATGGFTVLDDSGVGAPTVTIAGPIDGDSVTAPVVVTGAVADDDLAGWRLQLADHEGHPPITLASGVAAIDGALGTLDPTRLQNGLYTLTLRAWDLAGHEGKVAVEVVVEGELKIGHFAVAFEDATVPLGGIPITVTRAYDTRRAHEPLDFGYGWSVDYQAMRVQESRPVGARWRLTYQSQGLFGDWCVEPVGRPVVTVVRPDGKLEKFKPVAVPACNFLVPMTDVGIAFEPLPGTHSQLEQGDYDTVRLIGGDLVDLGDTDDTDVGPADPAQYTLTMADGTAYDLEQGVGMRRVTDLDGNSVVFGPNGIEHSSGVGIQFVRDAEGRIAQMRLPDGGTLRYTYNNAGELVTVADPLARTTRFAYAAGAAVPHYLRDIVDARGVRMSRVEYDASGRMVAHIDADGHRTELATDFVGSVHTVRDALGQVTTLTFDPRGNVTREQNPLGEVTLHTYDERGNELSRTDGEGRVTRWTYDAEDNQTSQTDALGQVTRWTHDARGQIVSQTEPDGTVSMANVYHPSRGHLMQTTDAVGNTTLLGYGDRGELVVLRRPQGDVTSYEHDYRGLPTREVAANGAVVEYTHDAAGRVLTETRRATDAAGVAHALVTTHTYDAAGQRLTTTDPLGRVARTEYDAAGQVVAEIDPSGDRTELTYDLAGRLALTRYPDGTTEQQTYDALGRQVATVDRAGRTTTMTYDAAGRLIRTRFADGAEVATTYDLAGRVATQVDARGGVTRFGYDAAGRRVTTVDPLGATTTTTYTATGRRAGVQDALGRTTKYVYDAAGKLTATLYPDLTAGDADNPRTLQSYDALGRVTSRTDEVGRVTRYEYAVTGQLVAVVDAAGGRTELTYDQRGNKVSQRDALGRVTLFEYDAVGQETARVLPGGQRLTRSYDGEGRLAREVDENGAATDYVYDRDDRVIEVRYADGLRSTTTYTASGQIATVTDREGGVTTRAYDAVDRLVRVSYPDGVRLDFAYDASGHRTSVTTTTAAGARAVSYGYDAAGRMATVDDGAGAMSYRYNAAGEVVELQRPNGVRSEYGYDVRSRPALFVERAANGNEVNRITYATDRSGLRTGVTEQGTLANRTISYQYDALRRLGRETLTDGHPQGQRVTAWTYDAVGNRLTETQTRGASVATVASTYDSNDRLERELAASGALVTYAYDAAGQTTTRTETTGPSTAVTTYTYDAAHRLAAATGPAGAMSYGYDADGIRQHETVDGVTTRFVVDPTQPYPQVIAELGGAAGPAAETHYAIGLGGGTRLTRRQAGVTTYLHTDALGSLRLATTAAGAIAERWAYRPFGAVDVHISGGGAPLPNTGPGVHTFLFAGEQYEPGLDLYYLRARHYAPASGRFTQADVYRGSDGDPLSLHRYAYAHGNPVTNRDPSGYATTMELTGTQLVLNTLRTLALTVPRLGTVLTTKTVLSTVAVVGSMALVGVTAREIVRRCMAGGLAGLGPCRSPINIFFLGAEHDEHTRHASDAISQGYSPLLRRKPGMPHDRGWLVPLKAPGQICEDTTRAIGYDCDEYPFAATEEGGEFGMVSLRPVYNWDNQQGGNALKTRFYDPCNVPAGPQAVPFLVIASEKIPITGGICKK